MRFIVNKDITLNEALALAKQPRNKVSIDIETVSLENQLPLGLGVAIDKDTAFYFFDLNDELAKDMVNKVSLVIGHNVAYDIPKLRHYGYMVQDYDDTMLMAYSAGMLDKSLADLSMNLFLRECPSVTELWRKKDQGNVAIDHLRLGQICMTHAMLTYQLSDTIPITDLYLNIDKPCIELVMEMEGWGVLIDQYALTRVEQSVMNIVMPLEEELKAELHVDNLASNPQVADALKAMGIIGTRKTKSAKDSVSEDSLRPLDLPITNKLLKWRSWMKNLNTYIPTFRKTDHLGRLHTVFGYTNTGRWKSGDKRQGKPNLQNITRDEKFIVEEDDE